MCVRWVTLKPYTCAHTHTHTHTHTFTQTETKNNTSDVDSDDMSTHTHTYTHTHTHTTRMRTYRDQEHFRCGMSTHIHTYTHIHTSHMHTNRDQKQYLRRGFWWHERHRRRWRISPLHFCCACALRYGSNKVCECVYADPCVCMQIHTSDVDSDDMSDIEEDEGFPPYIFAVPALCDMVATRFVSVCMQIHVYVCRSTLPMWILMTWAT